MADPKTIIVFAQSAENPQHEYLIDKGFSITDMVRIYVMVTMISPQARRVRALICDTQHWKPTLDKMHKKYSLLGCKSSTYTFETTRIDAHRWATMRHPETKKLMDTEVKSMREQMREAGVVERIQGRQRSPSTASRPFG